MNATTYRATACHVAQKWADAIEGLDIEVRYDDGKYSGQRAYSCAAAGLGSSKNYPVQTPEEAVRIFLGEHGYTGIRVTPLI